MHFNEIGIYEYILISRIVWRGYNIMYTTISSKIMNV